MSTETNKIKQLIKQGEGQEIEFKESYYSQLIQTIGMGRRTWIGG